MLIISIEDFFVFLSPPIFLTFRDPKSFSHTFIILAFKPICDNLDREQTKLPIVYVIGLHAVQFGNNWMRKIPRTAKLDEAVGRVQFGSPRNFLNPIISKFDKHVVLLPINYRASENFFFFFFFCSKFV